MKSTFSVLFYLKRNGQKANGNMPIMGRITVNGQAVQFAAKVEIKPEYWNVQAGKAIGRNKVEVQEVNNVLESIKTTMTKIYRDLQEKETSFTPERIKNIFFGIESKNQMLLEIFRRHNEDIHKLIGISKSIVCYNRADFERALEKQNISVLFRTNDEGRIYGATFIDHEQKCVFNGSRLGKEFSANVFNDLFNANEHHKAGQSFDLSENLSHEKENGASIGGLFDLLPEAGSDSLDNAEKQAFNHE